MFLMTNSGEHAKFTQKGPATALTTESLLLAFRLQTSLTNDEASAFLQPAVPTVPV